MIDLVTAQNAKEKLFATLKENSTVAIGITKDGDDYALKVNLQDALMVDTMEIPKEIDGVKIVVESVNIYKLVSKEEPTSASSSTSVHYIERCSCGALIATCKCPAPDKPVRIIESGCDVCKLRATFKAPR